MIIETFRKHFVKIVDIWRRDIIFFLNSINRLAESLQQNLFYFYFCYMCVNQILHAYKAYNKACFVLKKISDSKNKMVNIKL